jgi:hypothetical protein
MGGFFSTPVLSDVQTPTVLNFILQEMFRRSDLVDIYSLADPKRCDRYVVAGADALDRLFVKLRVNPLKGPNGTLYFQSLDGLISGAPKDIKDKRKENCLELSFFFIRIFQIFGAVTISMFDNTIPLSDPVYTPSSDVKTKKSVFLQQQNFDPYRTSSKPKSSSWFGLGGALTPRDRDFFIPTGPYKILNYYISRPDAGSSSTDSLTFPGFSNMSLSQPSLYDLSISEGTVTNRKVKENPAPLIKYVYMRDSNPYVLTATLDVQGIDTYNITLKNYKKDSTDTRVATPTELFRTYATDAPLSAGNAYPDLKGKSLPTVLQAMFEDAGVQIFGAAAFSTVKYLRKMRYVGSTNADTTIAGTHVTIPGSQDNKGITAIVFRDSMSIPPSGQDSKKVSVTITATLEIDEPRQDITDNSYKNRLYIDFSKSVIKPPEAAEYIHLRSRKYSDFIAYSKDANPKSESSGLTIPAYIETVFQNLIKQRDSTDDGGVALTRQGLPKPYDSEDIPRDLRIKELWNALAKDPPIKSYCIARAIQLLSVDAIRGKMTKQAFSSACSLSFVYQKDGSVPADEGKLSDVHGLHALATLFWTGLETKMPKVQDEAKYKNFLRFMKMNLENFNTLEQTPQPEKMSSIEEKGPRVCDLSEGARLLLPSNVTGKLQAVVQALIAQQRNHINAGMQIIELLFDMDSVLNRKQFAINPEILRGGMPEVNRVTGIARDLLMKYYSGCESTYRDGLKILYQADQQTQLVAIGMDGRQITRPAKTEPTGPTGPIGSTTPK